MTEQEKCRKDQQQRYQDGTKNRRTFGGVSFMRSRRINTMLTLRWLITGIVFLRKKPCAEKTLKKGRLKSVLSRKNQLT